MKTFELKPSYENLLRTLLNDTINRNNDLFAFVSIINNITDSFSISLDGNWGSGKTFFVKQAKMILDSFNDNVSFQNQNDRTSIRDACKFKNGININPHISVYYDAWENDNDSEPIFSLIYSILSNIDSDFSFNKDLKILDKAAAILEFFSKRNWKQVIDSFRSESPLKEIKKEKELENTFKEFLDSLLIERGNRLVIFIDELDRCNPQFSVRLLERIKHYFNNDKITFVFSVNLIELQHTIKKHYGENLNAVKYLDRFFDLRLSLPAIDIRRFYNYLDFDYTTNIFDITCDEVIKKYNFSLREIEKYIRTTKTAAYKPTHNTPQPGHGIELTRKFCLMVIIPIMIGLKMHNRDEYEDFINGKNNKPLIDILSNKDFYWFDVLLSNNETFDNSDISIKHVSINDKLNEVYNALFVEDYSNGVNRVNIGELIFDKSIKSLLLRTESLFSDFAML